MSHRNQFNFSASHGLDKMFMQSAKKQINGYMFMLCICNVRYVDMSMHSGLFSSVMTAVDKQKDLLFDFGFICRLIFFFFSLWEAHVKITQHDITNPNILYSIVGILGIKFPPCTLFAGSCGLVSRGCRERVCGSNSDLC